MFVVCVFFNNVWVMFFVFFVCEVKMIVSLFEVVDVVCLVEMCGMFNVLDWFNF